MELKLNVYNGKTIEKTYTSNDFRLMTGTCEDILNLIEIDKLTNLNLANIEDDTETMMKFMGMFVGLFKQFNPIMKQIFDGLTDDEYRRTDIKEVAGVAWKVIQYTFAELFNASGKN